MAPGGRQAVPATVSAWSVDRLTPKKEKKQPSLQRALSKTRLTGVTAWVTLDLVGGGGWGLVLIKSFAHKGLERFFHDGVKKGIQPRHSAKLQAILDLLDSAEEVTDMNFPNSRLHLWEPKTAGVWSVDVQGPWRITFKFQDGDAYEVDYVQPH